MQKRTLLGERNWHLPRWLEWLPRLNVEGAAPVAPASAHPSVQTNHGDDRATIVLTGELDVTTSLRLRDALAAIEQHRPPLVVIDLRELRFMDSSGLAELIRATQRARADRRRVVLVTGSEPIDRVLAVSGVKQRLETTADPATLDT